MSRILFFKAAQRDMFDGPELPEKKIAPLESLEYKQFPNYMRTVKAKTKYFSGLEEVEGLNLLDNQEFAERFPGVAGVKSDSFTKFVAYNAANEMRPVTRIINRKKNPSMHKCDSRCRNAKGRNCECSCGGQYHGAG